jgi:hypothetical protein
MSPSRRDTWLVIAIVRVFAIVALLIMLAFGAWARDGGDWTATPDDDVRRWFQTLMQPDHPNISCCGDSDAYEADSFEVEGDHYVAIITGHRAVANIPLGTRIPVPNHKMKWDQGNPTGHGIIFVGTQGQVFCYVTPGGI